MERIKNFIRKIVRAISNLLWIEEPEEEIDEEFLTDTQKEKMILLNQEYSLLLDVIENQIEMMHINYFTNCIDEEHYIRKQEELSSQIAIVKERYINSINYICASA